jgi:predicted Zn-dependent protease
MLNSIEKYRNLIQENPNNDLLRFSLGKILFDAGQYREAKEQFETAILIKPDWMAVQILIAKCELQLGNQAAARVATEKAHLLAKKQNHQGPLKETRQMLDQLQQANSPSQT